jgi:hypothetical protein
MPAMTRRIVSTLLTALGVLAVGCGGRDTSPTEGPAIDVETDLKPGMSPEAVFALLGKPDEDETPKTYDPPVIREVRYNKYGLALDFHTKEGLGLISIQRRWTNKPVHGFRVGDRLNRDEFDYEKESIAVDFESKTWPEARLYHTSDGVEPDAQNRKGAKITSIQFRDDDIHGTWVPQIQFK